MTIITLEMFGPSFTPEDDASFWSKLCRESTSEAKSDSTETDTAERVSSDSPASSVEEKAKTVISSFLKKVVHSFKLGKEYRSKRAQRRIVEKPSAPTYTIYEIPNDKDHLSIFQDILNQWRLELDVLATTKDLTSSDNRTLADAKDIATCINYDLLRAVKKKGMRSFFVVAIDESGAVQAFGKISREFFSKAKRAPVHYDIEYLLTAPENLRLSFQTTRVRGAASAIIEDVAYRSLSYLRMPRIRLVALTSSVPFYTKMGFEKLTRMVHYELKGSNVLKFLEEFAGRAKERS